MKKKIDISKIDIKNIVIYFSVFTILITSGAGFINSLSTFVICGICFCILEDRIDKRYIYTAAALCAYVTFNSVVRFPGRLDLKEYFVLICRIVLLAVTMDKITIPQFVKVFVNIMSFLAVFSLFWYVLVNLIPGFRLPFQVETPYYGAFYHVLGFTSSRASRNSGIFWEPGVFQIYLNLAILMIVFDKRGIIEKPIKKLGALTIALITTVSSTGYLCFVAIVCVALISKNLSSTGKLVKKYAVVFFVIFLAVEGATGKITEKLVNKQGSFLSRHDDTVISFAIARDYPILGTGIACDSSEVWNRYLGMDNLIYKSEVPLARSNGLGNMFFTSGFLFGAVYLLNIYFKSKKLFLTNGIETFGIWCVFLMIFFSEPIMFTPMWLSFFFNWREEGDLEGGKIIEQSSSDQ